ncbi:MAG: hypothetical protein HYS27_18550 [Deltaproteobacteria bacterium]|nr:hypothetical protein [Deltaproteobacteria bacterium]
MPSASAPPLPAVTRELRVVWSRWHLWAALAVLGAVEAALLWSAAPLDGTRAPLLHGLAAAWLSALPVVVACGAADDARSGNLALLLQLGHGPARVTLAKACAAALGAVVLALPTVVVACLAATKGALPVVAPLSLVALALGGMLAVSGALVIAALIRDAGWAALATVLGTLGWLWLDADGRGLALVPAARAGALPLAAAAEAVVTTAVLCSLASILASPTASGERRLVRSLVVLAIGGALFAAASRLSGTLGAGLPLDVRARAAEATALGELGPAAAACGALLVAVGLVLAYRRR